MACGTGLRRQTPGQRGARHPGCAQRGETVSRLAFLERPWRRRPEPPCQLREQRAICCIRDGFCVVGLAASGRVAWYARCEPGPEGISRDPRTDAGETADAELTAARGVGCGPKREGVLETRGWDHPRRGARTRRSSRQDSGAPTRAARCQRPGDLRAKGTPRRRRGRCFYGWYPAGALYLDIRRGEDRQ